MHNHTRDTSRILSRKKVFWVIHPQRVDQEFQNKGFWIPNKQRSINVSGFMAVMSSSEKSYMDPANQVHPIPKTMIFWVHVRWVWHKAK